VFISGNIKSLTRTGGLFGTSGDTVSTIERTEVDININAGTGSYIGGIGGDHSRVKLDRVFTKGNLIGGGTIGGISGTTSNDSEIINSYSTMNITATDYSEVGGIVGYDWSSTLIENTYFAGIINNDGGSGGLIGEIRAGYGEVLKNNYWDFNTSKQLSSAGLGDGNVEGKTTVEMMQQATFVDWDFLYQWGEDRSHTVDGYPFLRGVTERICNDDFAGGDGSSGDPWQIATADHLNNVRNYLGHSYSDDYFVQTSDIDLGVAPWNQGLGWDPIGSWYMPFMGNYDGSLFTIINMFIETVPFVDYYGLFGCVENGILQRINLSDVSIVDPNNDSDAIGALAGHIWSSEVSDCSVDEGGISGRYLVGGLIGSSYNSEILLCRARIDVSGWEFIGGLVGSVTGTNTSGIVDGSYSGSDVSGQSYIGGIAGSIHTLVNISNSYSSSTVYGTGNHIGGIVGSQSNWCEIESCFAYGEIEGYAEVGGIVGHSSRSTVSNSYASGSVEAINNYAGGLTGYQVLGYVSDCYSTAAVSAQGFAGGLIGSTTGPVYNSYWDTDTSGQSSSAGGTGKSTLKMLQESEFNNWDFNSVWTIPEVTPYTRVHYPILQWQGEPGAFNEIENAIVKVFEGRSHYWESFPRLLQQNDFDSTKVALQDLAGDPLIRVTEKDNNGSQSHMNWDAYNDEWQTPHIALRSEKGYQLTFDDSGQHFMYVSGDHIDLEQSITLYEGIGNWVGYFVPHTQHVFDAIDAQVLDQISEIKSEEWSMRQINNHWYVSINTLDPSFPVGKLAYGKMYEIATSVQDSVSFQWNIPAETSESEELSKMQQTEFFAYDDGPDYESFFIEYIEDDEDVIEIGVFVGDECIGATVFHGFYPVEVLAYTNQSHLGQDVTFALHRESQRGEYELLHSAEVKDLDTDEFSAQVIEPLKRRFTVIRLGSGEGEIEPVVKPLITLAQSFPNPFVLSSDSRSNMTEIPFYVSEQREVTLSIFNIKGQKVRSVYSGSVNAGKHSVSWNGYNDRNQQVGSGIYFYRLETGDETITRKMLIVR